MKYLRLIATVLVISSLAWQVTFAEEPRQRLSEPRVLPVPESEWTQARKDAAKKGPQYNIMTTMARHPELAKTWGQFAGYILRRSTLPDRHRELVTLRIGWLCYAEYEFGQHTRLGKEAGLSEEEILRVTKGPDAAGWTDFERVLLTAVDELYTDSFISDATWEGLAAEYGVHQIMDMVFTVGEYNMVSMALNTFGVQLDSGIPGFPDEADKDSGIRRNPIIESSE
ncbi:MAG: carboxymuconolactone decarboxylase family protein [Gammaproteobacteria bacterium]|jgi:4-carboxymuconolactone decarboxylase|nr:carboxymuconolactone decarboxylase family protein [Gammaproteobacteria bacterium]MBT4492637.1 carboxymuconolactone decarboxylase family protein [Gammaproteobacteria bacterium]MBT7370763.1 carboxymuconolactone decarboxylase family protein [Gammaproteobacteria bacterium]